MDTKTSYRHIVKKEHSQEPYIQGTRITVRDIVEQWKLGYTPEEISSIYPHIKLSQIFESLAYYQDQMREIEEFITANSIPEELSGTSLSG